MYLRSLIRQESTLASMFIRRSMIQRRFSSGKDQGIQKDDFFSNENRNSKVRQEIIINKDDLEFKMVKGGGPGGQATNKTSNCAFLTHKPSGIQVKCHQSRDADTNKHYAIKILKEKLDIMINGDLSKRAVEEQKVKKAKDRNKRRSKSKHINEKSTNDETDSNPKKQ